ncbi:hypothetical protein ACVWWG_009358 [Bradyrhizobium sp. LB7.2]
MMMGEAVAGPSADRAHGRTDAGAARQAGDRAVGRLQARYYEDKRFQERILTPPPQTKPSDLRPDDWSSRPLPPRPTSVPASADNESDVEDPKTADRRQQPELDREPAEKKESPGQRVRFGICRRLDEDAPRLRRMTDMMQGVARQASLDPGDDLGL